MKFEINLEKLSDDELQSFLDMKKAGIVKKINGEVVPEKSKRDIIMQELEGNKVAKTVVPVNVNVIGRKRGRIKTTDYYNAVKKMGQLVRSSTKTWSFKELISKALNRRIVGGTDYRNLKPLFNEHLYGIRVIGKVRKQYISLSVKSKSKPKYHISEERRSYMSNKGKYVTSMAKKLCIDNPSLSWHEALSRSQQNFNEKHIWKKKEEVKVEEVKDDGNFPHFYNIKYPKILISMLNHLIQEKGKLTYEACSYPLSLGLSEWKNFCSDLIYKSVKICEYFKVQNNFRLQLVDDRPVVHYD